MILIKIEKCEHCFYCKYRDIIEYRDNFLDNNREMIFLISPNPILYKLVWHDVIAGIYRQYIPTSKVWSETCDDMSLGVLQKDYEKSTSSSLALRPVFKLSERNLT